jgi:hypothetical protein
MFTYNSFTNALIYQALRGISIYVETCFQYIGFYSSSTRLSIKTLEELA